ncbi:hypothetical protein R69619_03711 [Paraburkholderia nemoris]|uniref:restriction endonuclease n=1 Tax=Paraburkholderia nemoris TaxID=2793076 RepID=UPI00190B19F2|nr:restriction endonuclease [Paraburkholderia nemoris]MBK3744188.1 restriction endonuclease [Paraburkholderia aspalathi]CAE6768100.1 hypothetical protein R69619_03711 [Paraburkholderia nemoris]
MGRLEEELVKGLLDTSAHYKRDVMEGTIRRLLGAVPFTDVTGLPARRGAADGGIDGIIDKFHSRAAQEFQQTALNVKVRKSGFTREQLGGFLLDMDREGIKVGLIITAGCLAPDAVVEFDRKNREGFVILYHIRLPDLLSGELQNMDLFVDGIHIRDVLNSKLREILEQP